MKKRKRLLSALLTLCMMATIVPTYMFASAEETVTPLEASRLTEEELPGWNIVYFGTAAATLSEDDAVYSVPVYREGDLSGETSVEVRTVDLTALYGEDYELIADDAEVIGGDETILERYSRESAELEEAEAAQAEEAAQETEDTDGSEPAENEEYVVEGADEPETDTEAAIADDATAAEENGSAETNATQTEDGEATLPDPAQTDKAVSDEVAADEAVAEETVPEDAVTKETVTDEAAVEEAVTEETATEETTDLAADLDGDGYVSLAEQREYETGEPSRELTETESQDLIDDIVAETVPDAMNAIDASAKLRVYFAPGESEKTIEFRIMDDNDAEGDEAFNLLLADPEGAEVYMVTSLSGVITDNEETERSEVTFSKSKYKSKDGKVVVAVERKGAEYSVADMTMLSVQGTAKPGENYEEINETVAFAPYETEKEIEIPVSGEGEFEVTLSDLKACTEGKYTRATIVIDEGENANEEGSEEATLAAENGTPGSFGITIDGKNYTVEYNWGEPTGAIMDDSYTPALQVGEYYFPSDQAHGGIFSYGHWDGNTPGGTRNSHYQIDNDSDMSRNYGKLYYYYWVTGKKGSVWTETYAAQPAIFYRFIAPDWTMTSGTYGGQRARFRIVSERGDEKYDLSQDVTGQFDRTLDRSIFQIGEGTTRNSDSTFDMYAYSIDQEKNKTPKSYLNFYGAAAMFKRYDVSMETPNGLTYLTPTGTTESIEPAQVTVKSGAQLLYQHETRAIYANSDEESSNLVFSLGNSHVNGHDGKFGYISGYTIRIGSGGENAVTVNYPADFISYLNSRKNKTTGYIDYSASAVNKEINKVNQNLDTIPMDKYFIDWVEQTQVATSDDMDSPGYKQILSFRPVFSYNDVDVTVLAPRGEDGAFNNSQLVEGRTATFHAGDTLDLSATAADPVGTTVVGYEVSTDGGVTFDTITSYNTLFLESFKSYMIRPVIAENDNRIEIEFANSTARNNLEVLDVIPQSELANDPALSGRTILNLNPNASSAQDKMEPDPGKDYAIRIRVTGDAGNGYVYRPVITDTMTGKTYKTQTYYMNARSRMGDNVLRISVERVRESDLRTYTITGDVASAVAPIRSNGLELKELPVANRTVMIGAGQDSDDNVIAASAMTENDGGYTLMEITAKSGDRIPILISDGLTNGQVAEITIPSSASSNADTGYTVNVGRTKISYPTGIPKVTDITYSYDRTANNQSNDNTQNSINIYDDTINITAYADLAGRVVSRAIFTVYTVTGNKTEYVAYPSGSDAGRFTVSIPRMTDNLHNGDRVSVRLVDNEKYSFSVGNGTSTVDIEYPDVDTGLVFYTENVLNVPQYYEASEAPTVNVPVVGAAGGSASTGLLSFSRTYWDNQKSGYTLDVNITANYANSAVSTNDKLNALNKYKTAVKNDTSAHNKSEAKKAENIMIEQTINSIESDPYYNPVDPDTSYGIDSLEYQMKQNQKMINDLGSTQQAKDIRAGLSNTTALSVNAGAMLQFEFIYSPVQQEYIFCYGGMTIGGTVSFNKSFYTAISFVPCFFNLNGTAQVSIVYGKATTEAERAFTAGEFESLAGNVSEVFGGDTNDAGLDVMFKLTGQVGVGICGVLSARGYMSLKLQFDLGYDQSDVNTGFLMGSEGGIGFDILVGTININLFTAQIGFGSLKNQTSYSFFGGLIDEDGVGIASLAAENTDEGVKLLSTDENGAVVTYRDADAGTADMSIFGQSEAQLAAGSLEPISMTTLLPNAAERTRPQITLLDGGRKFITFVGNDGTGAQVLYYSIFDGSSWSAPAQVSNDGTPDYMPEVLDMGDRIAIVWADAERAFTDTDTAMDKLSLMNISGAVYDINAGVMSEETVVAEDEYCNLAPRLSESNGDIYCSYMARDLSGVENEEQLLDMSGVYSAMKYSVYRPGDTAPIDGGFTEVKHPTMTDPLLFDYHMETIDVGGESYIVSAYTIDEDEDLSTGEDRSMWLSFTNLDTGKEYYPIRLEAEESAASAPQLNKLDGVLYLTYITGGSEFHLMDISSFMTDLFVQGTPEADEDGLYAEVANVDAFRNADENDQSWYKRTADELGMSEDGYADTIYDKLTRDEFEMAETGLRQRDGSNSATSSYSLTSDGEDLYLFFTDVSSVDNGTYSTGKELYGMRYHRLDENVDLDLPDEVTDTEDGGFSDAAQITNYNKVIDEMDVVMDENHNVSLVSNYYEQSIDENGQIQFSDNALVELEFIPASSVEVVSGTIEVDSVVSDVESQLMFDVENDGMLVQEGYEYMVTRKSGEDGAETTVAQGSSDTALEPGDTESVTAVFTPTGENADTIVSFYVRKDNTEDWGEPSVELSIPYESDLEFTDTEITTDGSTASLAFEIQNNGRKPSEAVEGVLYSVDDENNAMTTYATFDIPALASGETYESTLEFMPKVSDFSELGMVDLKIDAVSGEETVADGMVTLSSTEPMVAEINDGAENVALGSGSTLQLETAVAPWSGVAGDVEYYSDDNNIASVDENGLITGNGAGNTTIYAYYPQSGITDDIAVSVTESGSSGQGGSGGGGLGANGFAAASYTVTFVSNGGSAVQSATVSSGETVSEPTAPQREGYVFAGWYADENLVTPYDFSTPVTRNITLYARWETATEGEEQQPTETTTFTDVPADAWYASAVEYVAENGIMNGVGDNLFDPEGSLTRAMFVTMLYRMEGEPAIVAQQTFSDVASDAYYAQAVAWAHENGVVNGVSETEFDPDAPIAREQMAAMMYRTAQYHGQGFEGLYAMQLEYPDAAEISEYAVEAVMWCTMNGVFTGTDGGRFAPADDSTRAEAAAVFQRFSTLDFMAQNAE